VNVVFRVDASDLMGTGHVMRCRTLANELRLRGARICFVTRKHPGHLADLLECDGFKVEQLPESDMQFCDEDYATWLGVSQEEDARQTIAALSGVICDLMIVDHYALDHVWESMLRVVAPKIMAIDDLANRNHDCDILIDQNYFLIGSERYKNQVPPSCKLLLGPKYALLLPEYAQARKTMAPRSGDIKRILIYMGGSDSANITGAVLKALSKDSFQELNVDVVIGPNFLFQDEISKMVKSRPKSQVYGQQPHLGDLMIGADIAVGAGGSTTWERLCLSLPSLVISIADNQISVCESLASSGYIRYLGSKENINANVIHEALVQEIALARSQCEQQIPIQTLVDGLGTYRVVETMIPTPASELTIRNAIPADAITYFNWVNDPMVRSSAIHSSQIDFAKHTTWFGQRLTDPNCKLFVLEAVELPVGQIRFEIQGEIITIDYSLDELVRGRGWGRRLIELGLQAIARVGTDKYDIRAVVKHDNIASRRIFESLNFTEMQSGTSENFCYQFLLPETASGNQIS
jgi:UDP-2,4-diacetamido-2,4,6-trideoxy-beta-L-altropyranose hydrolase